MPKSVPPDMSFDLNFPESTYESASAQNRHALIIGDASCIQAKQLHSNVASSALTKQLFTWSRSFVAFEALFSNEMGTTRWWPAKEGEP